MKIGMLFPGYGSQFVGMGKELYDNSRVMQEYFEEASNCLDINFVKLCFASSDAELSRMENAYPALFLIGTSLWAHLKQEGIVPTLVAGYNTGELAAIHAAGGINFPDGLYLLAKYSAFYQEFLSTISVAGLYIDGLSADQLQELSTKVTTKDLSVSIAAYDGSRKHTVMGHTDAIEKIREEIQEYMKDVKVYDAPVEVGLHSELMDPVALNFKLYLEKVDFIDLGLPLLTNAGAKIVTQGDRVKAAFVKQIHSPILWTQCIEHLDECDLILTIGPGQRLLEELRAHYPEKKSIAINTLADIKEVKEIVGIHHEQTEE